MRLPTSCNYQIRAGYEYLMSELLKPLPTFKLGVEVDRSLSIICR
jgi:hypothetical protein